VEADAGGKDAGGESAEHELLGVGDHGQRREGDDELELPGGAGYAGAIECGAAVSLSGRAAGAEAGDTGADAE
jgi:hypothetical protein